eukprot:1834106-Rhodomonas_salina.1
MGGGDQRLLLGACELTLHGCSRPAGPRECDAARSQHCTPEPVAWSAARAIDGRGGFVCAADDRLRDGCR